jgi:putative SOS response-associated peptidase YedK
VAGDQGRTGQAAYAIAMKDGSPFGLAGLWENWRNPNTGEWERTFATFQRTGGPNPRPNAAILDPTSYERWLGLDPDPHDLLITYPSEPMTRER